MSAIPARAGLSPSSAVGPRTRPSVPVRPPAQRAGGRDLPGLRLVPPVRTRPGVRTAPFVVLVVTLLAAGLVGLLMLNTVLAQDAFVLKDLRRTAAALTDQQQALMQDVAAAASPAQLAARARELGMVENRNPVFIRLADARVLGVPAPAAAAASGEGAPR